jgi:fluoroquinolone resistance protein
VAERKHGHGAPPTDTTVAGADWSDRDLSGQTHARVAFVDLDLTEARGRGATFTECTFRRARFNCSAHADAAFVNCTFVNCNFFDARFTECKLVGSMFDRCTYELMQVAGGNWSHVGMPGADLGKATFRGVRMREADLTGARCQGGSFRDVDLAAAWLGAAKLVGCDLRGSDLGGADFEGAELRGAIVTFEQAVVIAAATLGLDARPE